MPEENYDLKFAGAQTIPAPGLPYRPPWPKTLKPKIGLIGCGGITQHHLTAYREAGWDVIAFYDKDAQKAEARRSEFYPQAKICESLEELLAQPGLDVVDIATHPEVRAPLIEASIDAGRHVLSQKPFSLDLDHGYELARKAKQAGVKLAVNHNGRWAPYFAYLRQAVQTGLIGRVSSVSLSLNWDHTWTAGTPFERIRHLILLDFGIHWFDAACSFFPDRTPTSAFAVATPTAEQSMAPPLTASAIISFPNGTATLHFNGSSRFNPAETCVIVGAKGACRSTGAICGPQSVTLETEQGKAQPKLQGAWFNDGFRGTMGELLCAIEQNREPENSAESALRSHAACFAALRSADEGGPTPIN